MLLAFGYLMFTSEEDFTEHTNYEDNMYDIKGGIINKPATYPAFFQFEDSWSPNCLGRWKPANALEMVERIQKETDKLLDMQQMVLSSLH